MTVSTTLANNPAPVGATSGSGLSIGGLFTLTGVEDTLTAHAGGTKAAALALSATKNFHRVSVCATEGDSVLLPAATVGQSHFVRNDGVAPMKVYGAGTDTINGIAEATGVQQAAGSGALYECLTVGKWSTTGLIEAGTWTGTLTGTGAAPTAPQTATGLYVKDGPLVHLDIDFSNKDMSGSAGNAIVTGTPYASDAACMANGTCFLQGLGTDPAGVEISGAYMYLYALATTSAIPVGTTGCYVKLSVTYKV